MCGEVSEECRSEKALKNKVGKKRINSKKDTIKTTDLGNVPVGKRGGFKHE